MTDKGAERTLGPKSKESKIDFQRMQFDLQKKKLKAEEGKKRPARSEDHLNLFKGNAAEVERLIGELGENATKEDKDNHEKLKKDFKDLLDNENPQLLRDATTYPSLGSNKVGEAIGEAAGKLGYEREKRNDAEFTLWDASNQMKDLRTSLEKQVAQRENDRKYQELQEQLRKKEDENDELQAINLELQNRIGELQNDNNNLRATNQELQQQLHKKEDENANLRATNQEQRNPIKELEAEINKHQPDKNVSHSVSDIQKSIHTCLDNIQLHLWKGDLDREDIIHVMKTEEVKTWEILEKGTAKPKKVTLKSGIVGIFKGKNTDAGRNNGNNIYIHEVAAYQIDQLLGLQMVPLTVLRKIDGEQGSFQLWVNNLDTTRKQESLPSDVWFFQMLIAYSDRWMIGHNSHFLADDSNRVVLFDNGPAFFEKLPVQALNPSVRSVSEFKPSPRVLEKAKMLNNLTKPEQLKQLEHIGGLTQEQKEALLMRLKNLLQAIEQERYNQSF